MAHNPNSLWKQKHGPVMLSEDSAALCLDRFLQREILLTLAAWQPGLSAQTWKESLNHASVFGPYFPSDWKSLSSCSLRTSLNTRVNCHKSAWTRQEDNTMTTFSPTTLWHLWKHTASVGPVPPARSLPRSPVLKVHQGDLAGRGSLNSGWGGQAGLVESLVAPGGAVLAEGSPSPHSTARPLLASLQRSGGWIQSSWDFTPHKNSLQRCVLKDPIQMSF